MISHLLYGYLQCTYLSFVSCDSHVMQYTHNESVLSFCFVSAVVGLLDKFIKLSTKSVFHHYIMNEKLFKRSDQC